MVDPTAVDAVRSYIVGMAMTGSKAVTLKPKRVINYLRRRVGGAGVDSVKHGVNRKVAEVIKHVCSEVVGVKSTRCVLVGHQIEDAVRLLDGRQGREGGRKKRVENPLDAYIKAFG